MYVVCYRDRSVFLQLSYLFIFIVSEFSEGKIFADFSFYGIQVGCGINAALWLSVLTLLSVVSILDLQ